MSRLVQSVQSHGPFQVTANLDRFSLNFQNRLDRLDRLDRGPEIKGLCASNLGFVGWTLRGKIGQPSTKIKSFVKNDGQACAAYICNLGGSGCAAKIASALNPKVRLRVEREGYPETDCRWVYGELRGVDFSCDGSRRIKMQQRDQIEPRGEKQPEIQAEGNHGERCVSGRRAQE